MNAIRFALCAMVFVLLAGTAFAQAQASCASPKESQLELAPVSDTQPTMLKITLLAFEHASVAQGTNPTAQWAADCQKDSQGLTLNACILKKNSEYNADPKNAQHQFKYEGIPDATVTVFQYLGGKRIAVQGCQDIPISTSEQGMQKVGGIDTPFTYYFGTCDISNVVQGKGQVLFRASYAGKPGEICGSTQDYPYDNSKAVGSNVFNAAITDILAKAASGGGIGTLPCVSIFLVLGLLMASLYFSGKSPVTLLDLTTPRLPAPKGVTASGQILAPFGYAEMKRTVNQKMAAAAAALEAANKKLATPGDMEQKRRNEAIKNNKGDKTDQANRDMLAKDKVVATSLSILGSRVAEGMTAAEKTAFNAKLAELAKKLPYHYDAKDQETVAEILNRLEARGGADKIRAMTIKDYLYSHRTLQSLDTVTGHPDLGQRSVFQSRVTNTVGKAFNLNRYAVVGGVAMSSIGSTFNAARVTKRMATSIATSAPTFARSVARSTTMAMGGGERAIEELAAKARASPSSASAWLYGQIQKKPGSIEIGQMFPVDEKLGHLYKNISKEVVTDQMSHAILQMYRKMGVKFDITEAEMAQMGHVPIDILKRSKYNPAVEALDAEIRAILVNKSHTPGEKLNDLIALARSHGIEMHPSMTAMTARLEEIESSSHTATGKMIMLQMVLEEQNNIRMSAARGGHVPEDMYVCHVGGDTLRGADIWKTQIARTMIWNGENGYLQEGSGLKHALLMGRLEWANRLGTLNPEAAAMHGDLPPHMADMRQLRAVAEMNKRDMTTLFTERGKKEFKQFSNGQSIETASIAKITDFMFGGNIKRSGYIDPKTGRMVWHGLDQELGLSPNATMVDVKRHWLSGENTTDNKISILGYTEGRFTRSYVSPYDPKHEAEASRMPGSAAWTDAERTQHMKEIMVRDYVVKDAEQRMGSQFCQNAYGTLRETMRFHGGVMAGFLGKALEEKGLSNNDPDRVFVQSVDYSNVSHLRKLGDLMTKYGREYEGVAKRPMTYDELVGSKRAIVQLYEGGFAYYNPHMMLSDADRIMSGEACLRDNKGQLRKFIAEEVPIQFGGRNDLMGKYGAVSRSKDPIAWQGFMEEAKNWANEGPYNYDKKKVFAHVCWQFASTTGNYEMFWKDSGVTVEPKRFATPAAPSMLRYFGYEGTKAGEIVKPFRDIGLHAGEYVERVALQAGGPLLRAQYDITAVSSQLRMHSFRLSSKIMSGEAMEGMSEAEKVAYRRVAMEHGAYIQVWQYSIDRNPWLFSSSVGAHQAWESAFHMGPTLPFDVKTNLRSYMGKAEYTNFMTLYGFPMQAAKTLIKPYVNMFRGLQQSTQGYASSWDENPNDALRRYNYTKPRLLEALQSLNPFSSAASDGKLSRFANKLNVMPSSLEQRQLAGHEFLNGLKQGPSHVYAKLKGTYAYGRTFDTNPGEIHASYRAEHYAAEPMAEYLWRNREATYMYDENLKRDAMNTTMRRTVSAEALTLRRDQEIRGFGVLQNSLWGWANPLAFLWHLPMGAPSWMTPRDITAKYVARSKGMGGGGGGLKSLYDSVKYGAARVTQPQKTYMVVYCPICGTSNMRGSSCKNPSCRKFCA